MSQWDIVCLVILGFFSFFGYFKGFFTQFMSLASLVLAYLFAPMIGPHWQGFLQGFLPLPTLIVSRVAVFVAGLVVFIACRLLAKMIQKHFINSFVLTKYINRFGGALIGLAKGFCGVYLLYVVISWHPDSENILGKTKFLKIIHQQSLLKRTKTLDKHKNNLDRSKDDAEIDALLDELDKN